VLRDLRDSKVHKDLKVLKVREQGLKVPPELREVLVIQVHKVP
jgi:hypothetical protein